MQFAERVAAAVPLSQFVQYTDRDSDLLPPTHAVQLVAPDTCPVAEPAEQGMQMSVTAVGAYLPAVQSTHNTPSDEYFPGVHDTQPSAFASWPSVHVSHP